MMRAVSASEAGCSGAGLFFDPLNMIPVYPADEKWIALQIDFVAGQFHANAWDSGRNEDKIEWPLSPWRLLRAILAGWHRSGAADRETQLRVLDALADCPVFDLRPVSWAHARHYVPLGGLKGGNAERTLMFDSFIALERERKHATQAFVIWPNVTLYVDERRLLQTYCAAPRSANVRRARRV